MPTDPATTEDPDPEDIREILKKIRRIELKTRGLVRESIGGEYHSVFKGQGIDFDEFREYQHGDEVRSIDWNVTARMGGAPFIKKFAEERELTVFLAVDISASGDYGSVDTSKRELAAEVAALLAFSALQNKDKVGLLLFTDEVEFFLPAKGSAHILRLIREILVAKPRRPHTDPSRALEVLVDSVKKHALVFLISDFICDDFSELLKPASVKHDIIALRISDPAEWKIPSVGSVRLRDPETGEQVDVDTASSAFREQYAGLIENFHHTIDETFRKLSIDRIDLRTDTDYLPELHAFFKTRGRLHA